MSYEFQLNECSFEDNKLNAEIFITRNKKIIEDNQPEDTSKFDLYLRVLSSLIVGVQIINNKRFEEEIKRPNGLIEELVRETLIILDEN